MLGFVIFCTAFISILSSAAGNRDFESFLNSLRAQNAQVTTSDESSSSSSSNDARSSLVEQLRHMDLGKLLQIANQLKAKQENVRHRVWSPSNRVNRLNVNLNEPEGQDRSRYKTSGQLLQQLLQENKAYKNIHKKRLSPNSLLTPTKLQHDDGWERTGGLNEYSKIYVIIDPETLKNSGSKGGASSLLSKILARTSSAAEKAHQEKNLSKNSRYKGFLLKDNFKSRRYRRESKETYGGGGGGGGGSMDDDYTRPKRPRGDYGGGGGGGGGRTAIPYIRHRGDIYEKDH